MKKYTFICNIPDQQQKQYEITKYLWPEFMMHDPVANAYWDKLFEYFPEYQIFLMDNDKILGIANSIPFYCDDAVDELSDEGWDWVLRKGIEDHKNNVTPNMLNGLQIAIKKGFPGNGIEYVNITGIKAYDSRARIFLPYNSSTSELEKSVPTYFY